MKKFKLFSILAVCIAALSFASCDTGGDNSSYEWPSQAEAQVMFQKVASASSSAGLLMPGDTIYNNNKIQKDSVQVGLRISSSIKADSLGTYWGSDFAIMNFPVSKLAKYIKDDCVAKEIVEKHEPVTLTGNMIAYNYAGSLFIANPNDITFDGNGRKITIKFYTWNNAYSLAGIATNQVTSNKVFLMYLTPGAVIVDNNTSSTNLKTTSNVYGQQVPFTMFLQAKL